MIDLAKDIESLSEFKRKTPTFLARLKESGNPVVLTVNGRAAMVVQDAAAYQELMNRVDRADMQEFLRRSRAEAETGDTIPADAFVRGLGKKKPKK